MKRIINSFLFLLISFISIHSAPKISFTFDDPSTTDYNNYTAKFINNKILSTLKKYNIKSALFVCGKRINSPEGIELLKDWDNAGHLICNHTFSHEYFNSSKISAKYLINDILKNDSIIKIFKNYSKLLRFPFLKEGETIQKRDSIRNKLKELDYKNGHVTIDASDWYIDEQMRNIIKENPQADLEPFKQYYLLHLFDRANYYNNLSKELNGREISHTILLHDMLINAFFLDDLIQLFKSNGWEIVDAKEAYKDDVFKNQTNNIHVGESIIWSLAEQSGQYDNKLRYPAEDAEYEKNNLKNFTENYNIYNKLELKQIKTNFYVHTTYNSFGGNPFPSNGLIVNSDSGLILIDTPWNDFQTTKLIDSYKKLFKKDITLAIITHAHVDKIGGINSLLNQKIKTISTKLTADIAESNSYRRPEAKLPKDSIIIFSNIVIHTFYPGVGHTKDNIVVYFPEEKILYGGCFIKSIDAKDLGNLIDADVIQWDTSINNVIKKFNGDMIVIPGHGKIGNFKNIKHTKYLINHYLKN